MFNKLKALVVGVLCSVMSVGAFAEIDISAATTALTTDGTTAITAVGTALVGLAAVAVVFKWVKGAIFG
ncbi:major capsid protein [Endozoicomonas arenosclerae]|uniref:major capsid protein n=1 Tax=Endozoicomonas arenosclerae TaxID=1633495 RepID=UPI0009A2337C|nr:major capsid protein [Endozoicomonas arenosclerae]